MYLTGFQGLIRAQLYQKLHYDAERRKADKIKIINVYKVIVCDTMQLKNPKMAQNRPLKAKSPGSSPGNATKYLPQNERPTSSSVMTPETSNLK